MLANHEDLPSLSKGPGRRELPLPLQDPPPGGNHRLLLPASRTLGDEPVGPRRLVFSRHHDLNHVLTGRESRQRRAEEGTLGLARANVFQVRSVSDGQLCAGGLGSTAHHSCPGRILHPIGSLLPGQYRSAPVHGVKTGAGRSRPANSVPSARQTPHGPPDFPVRRPRRIHGILVVRDQGTTQGYVRVRRISGNNPFLAYGVVNDCGAPGRRSGDGAYVPARDQDRIVGCCS